MKNEEIAELFVNGKDKGRANNMFIEGDTIYSYGYHFPIAVRIGVNKYLFNNNGYSMTTRTHKNHVERALNRACVDVIKISGCDLKQIDKQIKENLTEIEHLTLKHKRARTEHMKKWYLEVIAYLKEQNKKLNELKKR